MEAPLRARLWVGPTPLALRDESGLDDAYETARRAMRARKQKVVAFGVGACNVWVWVGLYVGLCVVLVLLVVVSRNI